MAVTVGSSTRGMCRMPGALLRVSQALMHDKSHIQLFEICVFITSTLQRRKLRHREVGKLNVTKAQLVRGRVHIINMGGISGPETETAASQDALGTSAPPPHWVPQYRDPPSSAQPAVGSRGRAALFPGLLTPTVSSWRAGTRFTSFSSPPTPGGARTRAEQKESGVIFHKHLHALCPLPSRCKGAQNTETHN